MKAFDIGLKVGLLIWMHMQLANCNGVREDAWLFYLRTKNHRTLKSVRPSSCSCAAVCGLSVDCVSFSYDLQTRVCLFRNAVLGNTETEYAKSLADGCSLGLDLRHQVFRRHPYVSESRVCAVPPDLKSARKQVLNGVTRYTCENPDFKICLKRTVSVRQCTGKWENWTGMCERFKWKKPSTRYPLLLPCRSLRKFSVTISGTPNKHTRFDVYVKKGKDTIFYADFRFTYGTHKHCNRCNTYINNTWGSETHGGRHQMKVGETSNIQIILKKGVYMVFVNDVRRCRLSERIAGAQPEFIFIDNDVTLHSVKIAV